ncbi:MAG: hypothetical protein AB1349_12085 [Elusimicrobiota bacterium]
MKCPNCGYEQADGLTECQRCGLIFAKWKTRQEQTSVSNTPSNQQVKASLSMDTAKPSESSSLEAWLLIFSFPIVIPSLIINFLGAKRWGRVDFWLIAFDGVVLTALCARSPLLLLLILIAWITSILLWICRREKLPYGIFLGYSNKVAMRLIIGGVIFIIGLFLFAPAWKVWREIEKIIQFEKSVSVKALTEYYVRAPRRVKIKNAILDFSKKIFRVETNSGAFFYVTDPRNPTVIIDPRELWLRRNELVGTYVTLEGVSPKDVYEHSSVEFTLKVGEKEEIKREKDNAPRLFTLIENLIETNKGCVWLVSEPISSMNDTVAQQFLARTTHTGLATYLYVDDILAKEFWNRLRQPIPILGVTLLPDKKPGILAIQTWVPVQGTNEVLWMVFPDDVSTYSGEVHGIYLGRSYLTKGLANYVREHSPPFQKNLYGYNEPQVLLKIGALEYLHSQKLIDEFKECVFGGGSWIVLSIGYSIICWAVRIASRE